ncbi:MAG: hypothetical protein GY839_11850 [candidate division Zixibacteria bacterium]|nr:hypothetical protein [candidate division Zixibacteria bacterium]
MQLIKIIMIFALLTSCAFAQTYQIDWYVIASGGGHTESENYQCHATIGQPVSGTSSSESYWLEAGYWVGAGPGGGPDDYEYLPGDANMPNGIWPPAVIGSDVTYLVNYFRAIGGPCLLDGFYASADANGDCLVIGSDVTKLVTYFRGLTSLSYCIDYEPAWHDASELPQSAPTGWPNCEGGTLTSKSKTTPDVSK